jgi:condensin complex subunit 2
MTSRDISKSKQKQKILKLITTLGPPSMNPQLLPKKRGLSMSHQGSRSSTNNNSDLRINSNRGLSNRAPSRVISNHRVISNSRRPLGIEDDANDSFNDENAIHFNENKHTILSNFEEWIKLSTDNKITSKNSWQFALIDYFHDLNVIKDGESINFQRASATLDGCVKIYLSRVESAATETGKLLSGLSKKQDTGKIEEDADEEEKNDSDNENEAETGKPIRKINRIVESTLVDFDTIRIKKLEQELAIDPLFKKALAEFDEGGAKSLLLNTLNIDSNGRVIFDATTKPAKEVEINKKSHSNESDSEQEQSTRRNNIGFNANVNISGLELFIFKDNDLNLENVTMCPSLNEFQSAIADMSKAKSILNDFNTKINTKDPVAEEYEDDNIDNNDNNEDFEFGGDDGYGNDFNDDDDNQNDQNNESNDPINHLNHSIMQKIFNDSEQYTQTTVQTEVMDRDLMAYFDEKMKVNWRGPEHWRVAALKKSKKIDDNPETNKTAQAIEPKKKAKATQVSIDFFADDVDEDILFKAPKGNATIMKKEDFKRSEHKLPDDIRYNSARLTNLFTKPQVPILYFPTKKMNNATDSQPLTDENFFAQQYHKQEEEQDRLAASFHQAEYEDFTHDFGGEDDFGAIDFNDALEGENKDFLNEDDKDNVASESQVLGKRRPEYVNFSRVAKRVDVKLLKDNLWKTIKKEEPESLKDEENDELEEEGQEKAQEEAQEKAPIKTFGNVITSIASLYGNEQRKDLSTSFCFICLLHLANEHGLAITPNDLHDDLQITGF